MRVLFNTYPMAFHTPGGGEIQLLAYRDHLPAHGVKVSMFDLWNPGFLNHDVVHHFSCIGGSSHFCAFVKQLGLPLVVSSSLWITEETRHLYPCDEIRQQLSLADTVVANSDTECDQLAMVFALPREKFTTVYNGVGTAYLERVPGERFRDRYGIHGSFVLNVGNIEPRKNQLRLVQAMRAFPDFELVLIGHIRDPAYATQCMEEGAGQTIHVGSLPHGSDLLPAAMAACEAFALPSTLETPGLAALEAAAVGAPLVITEVGSTREYFEEDAQYVRPDSLQSITEGITQALAKKKDSSRLSRRIAQNFLWHGVTRRLLDVYRELGVRSA